MICVVVVLACNRCSQHSALDTALPAHARQLAPDHPTLPIMSHTLLPDDTNTTSHPQTAACVADVFVALAAVSAQHM
jgi:hypothetical protein